MIWPIHLQAEYGPPGIPIRDAFGPAHLFGVVLLALMVLLYIATVRGAPAIAFGLGWLAITLLPVSNLMTATGVVLAERTLFLPSAGAMLAVGGALALLVPTLEARGTPVRNAAWALLAALVAVGAIRSAGRQLVWKEPSGFVRHLEADAPDTYRAHLVASTYYAETGHLPAAERTARRALDLYQGDPQVFEQLGQMLRRQGRCEEALPVLAQGVRRFPDRTVARSRFFECALSVGDTTLARQTAEEAVRSGQTEFRNSLNRLLTKQPPPDSRTIRTLR